MSLLDIHVSLTYNAIAPLLGLAPTSHHTVAAKCPYCSAYSWSIYQDTKNLEEWHYCSQCKANGSVLSMAAELMGLPIATAIDHLSTLLHVNISDDAKESYQRGLSFYSFCNDFWNKARDNMKRLSYAQIKLLHELKWHNIHDMSHERFMQCTGRLYGILPRNFVRDTLKYYFPETTDHVVVVPFYKLPHRISGFLFATPTVEKFYGNPSVGIHAFERGEHGFAGMQFLNEMNSDCMIVTPMISNMIQLQMHNFSTSNLPLPILGWHKPATPIRQEQWASLSGKEIIIWEKIPTAMAIHHAILTKAKMSFVGPEMFGDVKNVKGDNWFKWIHHDPAVDIVKRIMTNAKPFNYAIKNWVRVASEEDKTKLLEDSCKFSGQVSEFVRSVLDPKTRIFVPKYINAPIMPRKNMPNSTGHTVVIEKDGKWFGKKGNIRFPGIIRATHLIIRPNRKKEYVGYVLFNEEKIPFKVTHNNATMRYFLDKILSSGNYAHIEYMGNAFRDRKGESFDPIDVACRFEYPEVIAGLDRIGWNGTAFLFKNIRIEKGRIHAHYPHIFEDDVPGIKQDCGIIQTWAKEILSRDNAIMELVWAFSIAICMQVTSEAVGIEPNSICFIRKLINPFIRNLALKLEVGFSSSPFWLHKWPRYIHQAAIGKYKASDNYFVIECQENEVPLNCTSINMLDLKAEPRFISQHVDKIILNYLKEFTKQDSLTINNQQELLEYTVGLMKTTFDFVDPTIIDKSMLRVRLH